AAKRAKANAILRRWRAANPEKVKSHNLDKTPVIRGTLQGIKGQYLILDTGVINIRKYSGYELKIRA
ncbi:MAG: hypothetical protein B7Z24_08500, partial [Pseudomonadales bacterium 32-42-5]